MFVEVFSHRVAGSQRTLKSLIFKKRSNQSLLWISQQLSHTRNIMAISQQMQDYAKLKQVGHKAFRRIYTAERESLLWRTHWLGGHHEFVS